MAKKGMKLSDRDLRRLMFMERWTTYSTSTGALSLEDIIREDKGNNFSSILSEDDIYVQSFNMKNIPKANILLVFGIAPRAIAYAAEIAIRHFDKYSYYPEFVAAGDGRGMFGQRIDMATWFENMMVKLGFDKEWAKRHHSFQRNKNRDIVGEIEQKINGVFCRKKPVVLAVTAGGNSLWAAQKLPMAMPNVNFSFFEPKQLELNERIFDSEIFDKRSYAVDKLLADVVLSQMKNGEMLPLSLEKKFARPEIGCVRNLVLRGYAGFFKNPKMFNFLKIQQGLGEALYKKRVAQLQRFSAPWVLKEQTENLLKRIDSKFTDQCLVIK